MNLEIDGRSAYFYTGGRQFDASLPTAVFIHGAQNDHSVWALQSRYFAHHGFSVLALDLPGHGRSSGPALASVEAMADWLLCVLDAAGVQAGATLIETNVAGITNTGSGGFLLTGTQPLTLSTDANYVFAGRAFG